MDDLNELPDLEKMPPTKRVSCPLCKAEPGKFCIGGGDRPYSTHWYMVTCHQERIDKAQAEYAKEKQCK